MTSDAQRRGKGRLVNPKIRTKMCMNRRLETLQHFRNSWWHYRCVCLAQNHLGVSPKYEVKSIKIPWLAVRGNDFGSRKGRVHTEANSQPYKSRKKQQQ